MLQIGTAYTHLVALLLMANRYTWPSDEADRGPTRSTCMWENLRAGSGMTWRGAAGCLWTFPHWHCWQSRHMTATSLPTPFHTKCAVTMRSVARMPLWGTLWMRWKTAVLSLSVTSGRRCQVPSRTAGWPLYLDSPHCQGEGLSVLQPTWTADLAGHHPGKRDACSRLHVRHASGLANQWRWRWV
jgi:hypothetical protein